MLSFWSRSIPESRLRLSCLREFHSFVMSQSCNGGSSDSGSHMGSLLRDNVRRKISVQSFTFECFFANPGNLDAVLSQIKPDKDVDWYVWSKDTVHISMKKKKDFILLQTYLSTAERYINCQILLSRFC